MGHESQTRYSKLVSAKLRNELVLRDGIVFNNDYEGNPVAGNVKIPVRDTEVQVSDYDKANGIQATNGSTSYVDLRISKDKAVMRSLMALIQPQSLITLWLTALTAQHMVLPHRSILTAEQHFSRVQHL